MTADRLVRAIPADVLSGWRAGDLAGDLADDVAVAALALARRFRAGATLWCAAPAWEPYAHHLAAEFGYPVADGERAAAGKQAVGAGERALPAFAVTGPDLVARARAAVRAGDILIAVAGARDEVAADLMRRTAAWGALSAWIGAGKRPPGGAADHVLWLDDPVPGTQGRPAADSLARLCRALRESTREYLEQPGPLAREPGCADADGAAEICVTCSDEGRLAEVITPPASLFDRALVRTAAGQESVDVTLVAPVAAGDLVLVHAGAALTRPEASHAEDPASRVNPGGGTR